MNDEFKMCFFTSTQRALKEMLLVKLSKDEHYKYKDEL